MRAPADPDWLATWRSADERAAEAILGVLAAGGLSEPAVAAELGVLLPREATLFVASSMPVRDIETFWPARPDPPRVLCNRGANGIDGTVSGAFGVAAAPAARPGGAVDRRRRAGPRHRRPARRAAARSPADDRADRQRRRRHLRLPARLHARRWRPGARHLHPPHRHPHGPRLRPRRGALRIRPRARRRASRLARGARASAARPSGSQIVEVRSDRAANVELHRRVWAAVARRARAKARDPVNGRLAAVRALPRAKREALRPGTIRPRSGRECSYRSGRQVD